MVVRLLATELLALMVDQVETVAALVDELGSRFSP